MAQRHHNYKNSPLKFCVSLVALQVLSTIGQYLSSSTPKKLNRFEHDPLENWYSYTTTFGCSQNHCRQRIWRSNFYLDKIDLVSNWVLEDEFPADDLSWLDEETEDPSSVPFSEMETLNTLASQLLLQSSDVGTISLRLYSRCSTSRSHA